jgi:hypothetical protein
MVAAELDQELQTYGPNAGEDFRALLHDLKHPSGRVD